MILATLRDLREFLEAKRRKREPLRFIAKGRACASFSPRDPQGFERIRASMRGVGDWGRASERLDALEHALFRRHQVLLPVPRRVLQNEDCSLSVWWESVMVRCFPDGFTSLIGGTQGKPSARITSALLDMLAFQVRIQAAS
jgi:hypothetical protein